jgi:hypothetical protein
VAHDSSDSGNPVKIGGKAISAAPTAVAANDRTDLYTDLYGQLRVNTTHITLWEEHHDFTAAQTDHEVKAADAALALYVTDIIITNDSSAAITVYLETDTASAKTKISGTLYIPASGGLVTNLTTPIKGTAAKNIGVTSTGVSNWSITLSGYLAA